ncbi:putative tetratricopeptide-like helical domain, DYW domain-containing protein [Rosa chinensis]|uniref:Putative tetratricopeptide-like helical domain, DYW domain-containing protein n=1 Tax=Rosa chinensis TaxID=74649 RepID=A0A2P6QFE6_ROSCH|nr:pentatricopeptide repeat-containing protein At2g22410, mitochondrial [Rosa chinensis]XP_040375557.1 pentatricopeptide repeat-containing protein At2g22410, mitochondrial [Rosa chinensis]XP_040375558.1 pentatricopeptide repeat-containing protein At2g22410, mitochondrial [Rosa chinensis]PRQ32894.1 putative tetratricopeptide-like helical domain, DYW domain-containing protein [Rosa chinensis]
MLSLRPQRLFPNPVSHRLLSLSAHRHKPTNWNTTTHKFVQANPLLSLLETCKSMPQLKQIQTQMIITGFISDGFASSRLIAFCALSECRNLHYATKILHNVHDQNAFSWNVVIRGFSETENPRGAVVMYREMLRNGGSRPDNYTYPLLLGICSNLSFNLMGRVVLGHVFQVGLDSDRFVRNAAIHMFVSCRELGDARKVFDESSVRDLVSWNSLIHGYVRSGLAREALRVYEEMEVERVEPDQVTMIGVVSSCAQLEDLSLGRKFHGLIREIGLGLTPPLANALMDMYAKCGNLEAARAVFDNMKQKTIVSWTTMIVGYAKHGFLEIAHRLLYEVPESNVVPWNAMIGAYVQARRSKEALALFHEMQSRNISPDEITMVCCLSACSQLGAVDVGIWIHHYIEKHDLSLNVALGTALVDMYAKCGNITKALNIFSDMPGKNCFTWTSIICGLALNGHAHDAISYFEEMIDTGLKPDEITFLGVLSACCHGGLVEEGRKYFSLMNTKFNICPKLKHYSCMVDLLGRAGLLQEAADLINSMPIEADAVVWGALFFACYIHKSVLMGERAATKLLELESHDSGIYVLLAKMYRESNMWEKAEQAKKMMKERGLEKTPGCSSIEVSGSVCEFIVRDKSHPHSKQIYDCLFQLTKQMDPMGGMSEVPALWDDSLLGDEFR